MIKELFFIYIGIFVGAALLALGVYFSGQLGYSSNLLGAYTIKVAVGKTGLSFGTALVSGILCNILVCVAVLMAICSKDIVGKLFVSFFVIMLFVVCGFEHCVANMGTFSIAYLLFGSINPVLLAKSMICVTLGNIVGGALLLAAPLKLMSAEK